MTRDSAIEKNLMISMAVAALIAALFIAMGLLPENGWWGINHLFFFSDAALTVYLILLALVFLPVVRKWMSRAFSGMDELARGPTILILAVFAILFIVLRVAVYSLGDGYQRSYEIERGLYFKSTEMLDFAAHAAMYHIVDLFGWFRATTAMALTSIIAGVVFVFVLLRHTPFSGWRKSFLALSVFSFGGSQLFFGYVESYTLLYLFSVWYVFLAFRLGDRKFGFKGLTVMYLLAGLSHASGIILWPSFMLLAHYRFRTDQKRWLMFGIVIVISALPLAIPQLLSNFYITGKTGKLTDFLLPLSGTNYNLFSPVHFFDILNLFILVAPIIFVLAFFMRQVFGQRKYIPLVVSLLASALMFILLIDPKLTMARDWDLFTVPVAMCAVPILILIFKSFKGQDKIAPPRIIALILVSLVIQSSWIVLNSVEAKNLRRAEYILDHSAKNQRYGYELLAYYYSTHKEYEGELRMLEKIKPEDRTARVYGKMSQAYYTLKRFDEAYQFALIGVNMPKPNRLNAIMAGLTTFDRGEYLNAIFYFRAVLEMDPDDSQWFCKLGESLSKVDSLDEAYGAFSEVIARNPNLPCGYFGMAELYFIKENYTQAAQYCERGLQLNPGSASGRELMQKINETDN
jgi:hypothetical protein